jgi:hypothetical protein
MMKLALIFGSIFIVGEILLNTLVFPNLKKRLSVDGEDTASSVSRNSKADYALLKGVLERFVLFFALTINLPQILVVFGALKIGTRLDKSDAIKNDYFIIGNFSSILAALIYFAVHQSIH